MMEIKTVISNYIWPEGLNSSILKILKEEMSIPNPAYLDAIKFKKSKWVLKGLTKRINSYIEVKGKYGFPRGNINRYIEILKENNIETKLVWETSSYAKQEIPDTNKLNLWEHQKPWVDELLNSFQGIGQAPCGAGKTLMAIEVYLRLGQPCLWLTHSKALAEQVTKELYDFTGITAGLIGAGNESIKHFTVGLVPTLKNKDLTSYADLFGLIIVDECNRAPAETFTKVLSSFKATYRYGVTATPYRDDGLDDLMFHSLGPITAVLNKEKLRSIGKLIVPEIRRIKTNFNYKGKTKKVNYIKLKKALSNDEERNNLISTDVIIEASYPGNVCIVLVSNVEHGLILEELISPIIDDVRFVYYKLNKEERASIMNNFLTGKTNVLIATYTLLAVGFNYKPANRLFLTAPIKGKVVIVQACGRVERPCEGKKEAIVYDYVDEKVDVLNRQSKIRLETYEEENNLVITY